MMRARQPRQARRARRALVIVALVLAGTGCGDDGDGGNGDGDGDESGVIDAGSSAGSEGEPEVEPEDEAPGDGTAPVDAGPPTLDGLTDDQVRYAEYVCQQASRWIAGSFPVAEELGIIGSVLNAGEGGPHLEPFGARLLELDDPAAGVPLYEEILDTCSMFEQDG